MRIALVIQLLSHFKIAANMLTLNLYFKEILWIHITTIILQVFFRMDKKQLCRQLYSNHLISVTLEQQPKLTCMCVALFDQIQMKS